MGSFTMPEDILGIPLWVPSFNDYFDIETGAMPNGDSCLAVRGDVSNAYKAFMAAPVLSPHDIFNVPDVVFTTPPRAFSMSCWFKLSNLGTTPSGNPLMLGCTAEGAGSFFNGTGRNPGTPLILGPSGTNGWQLYREPMNNIASPDNPKTISMAGSWENFQNYWHLFVFTCIQNGTTFATSDVQATVALDTYAIQASDSATGGSASGGPYTNPRYVHIGGYPIGSTGRADLWRMAKWAFHDHVLTQAERAAMWHAMYGTGPFVYVDDFNDSVVGLNWGALAFNSALIMSGTEAQSTSTTQTGGYWVRDLGTPNHYAQAVFTGSTSDLTKLVGCRLPPYGTGAYAGGYWLGTSGNAWTLMRNNTGIGSISGTPSYPCTVRLETQTNGSNNVDLRFYLNGSLYYSLTDTDASRVLTGSNTGLMLRGSSGITAKADNWECGTL